MDAKVISMGGAAWLASFIMSFPTKREFVEDQMKGWAFIDKDPSTRKSLFGQVYDLAVPRKK